MTFLFRSHKGPQRLCVKQMKSEQCTRSGWSIVIFATCYGTPRLSQSQIYQNFALKLFNLKILIKIFDRNSVIGYGSPSFLTIFELNGLNDYQAFSFWIWFEYNIFGGFCFHLEITKKTVQRNSQMLKTTLYDTKLLFFMLLSFRQSVVNCLQTSVRRSLSRWVIWRNTITTLTMTNTHPTKNAY